MQKLSRILALVFLVTASVPARDIGPVDVTFQKDAPIPVKITASSAELQNLAQNAFSTHGRYSVVASRSYYDFKFTAVNGTQVRVDITKSSSGTPVASETASGATLRQALLRAADAAVVKTNGLGLKGFFAARLAFVSQRSGKSEIYVSDLYLGEAQQVTSDRAPTLSPRWSPDGSRIIYTSYFKNGAPDIYLLDPRTNRKDVFAQYRGTNSGARFSPNGQQVAMVCTANGTPEIFVSNSVGQRAERKTRIDAVKSSPCWSPDGSQIVFAMGEPGPQLYTIPASGGTPKRVSSGYTYTAEPDWSRTERNKIACTVRVSGRYQIGVLDLSTGQTAVVSQAPFDALEPSWLADGRHIICTQRDRNSTALYILDTVTKKSVKVPGSTAEMQAGVLLQ